MYQVSFDKNLDLIQKQSYSKHEYAVWVCRLSSNGKNFIAGDEVKYLYLYDCSNGELIAKNSKAHDEGICDITFQDELMFYSGSFDGTIA